MRRRLALLAVVVAGTAVFFPAASQPGNAQQAGTSCDLSAGAFRAASKHVYAFNHWRRGPKPAAVHQLKVDAQCVPGSARIMAKDRALLHRHQAYRRAAPFRGLSGEGYWLRWTAVPPYIVRCETQGRTGMARFRALNPSSGAGGYAQALPSTWAAFGGRGLPQNASPLEQHRIFHRIWQGQGPSGWSCA